MTPVLVITMLAVARYCVRFQDTFQWVYDGFDEIVQSELAIVQFT